MVRVRIDGIEREYPADATWQQVAGDYQDSFENDILLVKINGKLQELHKRVREGSLSFVTAEEKPGMSAYQRSATLMMLKAFYEVVGSERIRKVSVDFSIGKGFFVEPEGDFELTSHLLLQVK